MIREFLTAAGIGLLCAALLTGAAVFGAWSQDDLRNPFSTEREVTK